jgi:hypothetical protein
LDYLANLLQTAVETLLFYHPGVWWISRRIREERELICDDLAAKALGEPRRLVLALRELDLFQLPPNHLAQAAHGGNLMHRIRRLIQPEPRPMAWKALLAVAGFATLCGASAVLARAQTAPPAKPDMPFAIVDAKKGSVTRSGASTKELRSLRAKLADDFFWFRSGGTSYVVADPALVARAHALYQPVEDLGAQMGALGREMGEVGRKMDEAGRPMKEMGARMKELGKRMETLNHEADAGMRKLADEALASGKAKPAGSFT